MFDHKIDSDTELRMLSHADAQALFDLAYENRRHLSEWMFWIRDDYSLEDAKQYVQFALDQFAANNGFEMGIWVTDKLAGCIRFNYIDWDHRSTELRYWLGSSFQGRGLATNACRTLIDYAFAELGLNRVEIRCMSENVRSRAVPERLGFTQEGILRQVRWRKDHFVDHYVYGMLASEWHAQS